MKLRTLTHIAAALAWVAPGLALAEADLNTTTGSGTLTATAHLDFRIIIPKVLYFAVGSGSSSLADDTTVDQVTFDYSTNPASVGTGAAPGATTNGTVNVRVLGNNGVVAVTATTAGALANAETPADTIAWSQISTASSDANFPAPTIPDTGTSSPVTNIVLSSGTKITNRSAQWTYTFANTNLVAPGIYGTSARNGRVTYTATMP